MGLAEVTNFIDWIMSRKDGQKLAEVNSDLGLASGPEDYEFIRKTLPTYEINNPSVVGTANNDIDKALANYKTNVTTQKAIQDQTLLNNNIREFGNLYPDWREEAGPTAPISKFYSDYSGRIDPAAVSLEPYQKAVQQYTGGLSEGDNRAITAQETISKLQGKANLAKYIANTELKPGIKGWNSFVEGMYALPNVDTTEVRNILKEMEDRNTRPTGNIKTYTANTSGSTSIHKVDTDMFGRPVQNTGVTASHTPAQTAPTKPGEMNDMQKLLWKTSEDAVKDYQNYLEGRGNVTYDDQGNVTGYTEVVPNQAVADQKRKYANETRRAWEQAVGKKKVASKAQPPAGFTFDKNRGYWVSADGKKGWRP